ncbi:amidohydrolase family protein [Sorangium sp. So ce542]|uniref:amidohydrolase family protein n=1 Tax=Sorangium sp. So ce542 TaxID=3133316 RepID=UPI003F5D5756
MIEPIGLWRRRLPPAYRDRAPYLHHPDPEEGAAERWERLGPRGLMPPPVAMLEGRPVWQKLSPRAQIELSAAVLERGSPATLSADPAGQIADMDRSGIDVAVLYPTLAWFLLGIDDLEPAFASALARAYNDWLRDFCAHDPARLRGAGAISLHEPAEMVAELERVASFGWTTVVLRPNPVRGRPLSDAAYEPFWAACERRSLAVAIHEGAHARVPSAGADRFHTRFALHACSHPMEQMMAFLALVEGGVLERHPALRCAFLEAGCGWVPYWLWRLDDEYAHLRGEVAENVRMKPSEYFRRQCFVAIEPGEPYLPELVRHIGEDNLLFGTDFPHLDHGADLVERTLCRAGSLPEALLRKLLWENPARLHRISR